MSVASQQDHQHVPYIGIVFHDQHAPGTCRMLIACGSRRRSGDVFDRRAAPQPNHDPRFPD